MKATLRLGRMGCVMGLAFFGAQAQQTVTTSGGTVNVIPKFSGSAAIGNSAIFESGGAVGLGTTSPSSYLDIYGATTLSGTPHLVIDSARDTLHGFSTFATGTAAGASLLFQSGPAGSIAYTPNGGVSYPFFVNNNGQGYFAGNVGIGTASPSSMLTVSGTVQSTSGGFMFPDGSVQATAGIQTPGNNGSENTAVGLNALQSVTNAVANTAVGFDALQAVISGANNTGLGLGALENDTTGSSNTGIGSGALASTTIGGSNTAVGYSALSENTSGSNNTAVGYWALHGPNGASSAQSNAALGNLALYNDMGNSNVGVGSEALFQNTTGANNVAVGALAAINLTSGTSNIALGYQAGSSLTTGNFNIDLGNSGTSGDSNVMRLGDPANQLTTYIAGIDAVNIGGGSTVVINSNGQLGTILSSARYKQDIRDMQQSSDGLMSLRPVTFRYKEPQAHGRMPIQYGLIGEEVAKIYPELIVYGKDGQVESVQYHELPAMLLNEIQKQHRTIEQQQEKISLLEDRLLAVEKRLTVRTGTR